MDKENKSKNIIIILLSVIIILLIVGIICLITFKDKKSDTSNNNITNIEDNIVIDNEEINDVTEKKSSKNIYNENTTNTKNTIDNASSKTNSNSTNDNDLVKSVTNNDDISKINEAIVNGSKISLPATKESFENTGWEWDEKYANTDLADGYTTSGGRLGKYPGGAVVNVINKSGQTQKIQDCTIDSITFYNPGDGSENVTFIGGLNYSSSIEDVKSAFSNLGFKNVKERDYETSNYLTYYLDDNTSNYRDYIEFYFSKDSIKSVSIKSSVK